MKLLKCKFCGLMKTYIDFTYIYIKDKTGKCRICDMIYQKKRRDMLKNNREEYERIKKEKMNYNKTKKRIRKKIEKEIIPKIPKIPKEKKAKIIIEKKNKIDKTELMRCNICDKEFQIRSYRLHIKTQIHTLNIEIQKPKKK